MIEYYSSPENPFKQEILELMERNNEETTPSIQQMVNKWIVQGDLGFEEAIEKFYEERTDEVLVSVENGEVKGFFLLEENDEGIKDKIPEYWPHIEISLGIVRKQYRGKGISTELLEYVESNFIDRKETSNLVWVTSTANNSSKSFAQKNAFEKAAEFSEDREDGEKTVLFAKKI